MFNLPFHCVVMPTNLSLTCHTWLFATYSKLFATILLKSSTEVYISVQTMFQCVQLITEGIVTEQRSNADISDALATVA